MDELKLQIAIMLKKINEKSITLEDIDFSCINTLESSINYASEIIESNNFKLWSCFKESIEKNSLSKFDCIKYKRDLNNAFEYLIPFIDRAYKHNSQYALKIVTMKAILLSLDIMIDNFNIIEALTQ